MRPPVTDVRILVAHNVGAARTGGMSRIMGFIHDEIEAAGHHVDWFTAENVPPRWTGAPARFAFPWLVRQHAAKAARLGVPYDLINVHEPQGALVVLGQKGLTRHGVVVTSHGLEERAWQLALEEGRLGRGGPPLKSRLLYPATSLTQSRLALTRARLVLTLNDADRDYLTTRLGVPRQRVGRMRPGASPSYAAPAGERTYDSATRLLFAGTWRKNKGTQDLVTAYAGLARRHHTLTLTVLGSGVPDPEVLSAFPQDVRSRVHPMTSADEACAVEALASADVFVLPSLFEGTPLTLIEAMMSGLPVVTTNTCGMRDVVRDGVNGLLVPTRSPEDLVRAIENLLGSEELRRRLGRAAHETASRSHTWPVVAAEVLAAYERTARGDVLEGAR
jgi:glycosyltransferase involved in cell wall biosynthesis